MLYFHCRPKPLLKAKISKCYKASSKPATNPIPYPWGGTHRGWKGGIQSFFQKIPRHVLQIEGLC